MTTLALAFRLLLRQPGFSTLVVLTLAVGVGVATLVFGIYMGTMVATPSFTTRGDRMVFLEHYRLSQPGSEIWGLSEAGFLEVSHSCGAIEQMALVQSRTMILSGQGLENDRILGNWITAGGLASLGIEPVVGRVFSADEGVPEKWNVMVIGHDLWRRRYGLDPEVVGREEIVNGQRVQIIGVMPEGFDFVRKSEAWMPFQHRAAEQTDHSAFGLDAFGLLAPGATLAELNAELESVMGRLREEYPDIFRTAGLRALPVTSFTVRGDSRSGMHLLLGAMALVLIITTATIANLTLARMGGRLREFATRAALGATRAQLIGLMLAESLWLGLAGGLSGFLVGWWGVDIVRGTLPPDVPNWLDIGTAPRIAGAALVLSVGASLLCGLFLGVRVTGSALWADLRDGGRSVTTGRSLARMRGALVVVQVAIAATLLVGAGLSVRSYYNLQHEDRGYDATNVHTFRVGLPPIQYSDMERVFGFFAGLAAGMPKIEGVSSAALVTSLPGFQMGDLWQPDQSLAPASMDEAAIVLGVSPGYFDTMGITMIEGRDFTPADMMGSGVQPMIVSESFARRFLKMDEPLGAVIQPTRVALAKGYREGRIVGIVADTRQVPGLTEEKHPPILFSPISIGSPHFVSGVLRVDGNAEDVIASVRALVRTLEPGIPIYYVETLENVVDAQLWGGRLFGSLFAAFGGLALLLAMLGIYGVLSRTVLMRTQEISVRCALGASPLDVVRLVGWMGARLIGLGMVLGLVAAAFLVRFLEHVLFEVSPRDPFTFTLIPLLLMLCGALACLVPVLRALRIPPGVTMRGDGT